MTWLTERSLNKKFFLASPWLVNKIIHFFLCSKIIREHMETGKICIGLAGTKRVISLYRYSKVTTKEAPSMFNRQINNTSSIMDYRTFLLSNWSHSLNSFLAFLCISKRVTGWES